MFGGMFGNRRASSPARGETDGSPARGETDGSPARGETDGSPARGDREAAFDWRSLPAIEPDSVDSWFGCTDAKDRQLPFQIALQVHDELEARMMTPIKMDALSMAEIRGGLRALSRYCKVYQTILEGAKRK